MAVEKGKRGLIPLFTDKEISDGFDRNIEDIYDNTVKVFQYVGEGFVNDSRNLRTYRDVTGNLRSSIGYTIAVDAEVEGENFQLSEKGTDRNTGLGKGKSLAARLAKGKGIVLVGVAGMEYAADVEARGKDVITAPTIAAEAKLKELMVLI